MRRTRARSRRRATAGIPESSCVTATIDGVLPPAAVRRQLNESAWHLGFAPALHDLPRHLPDARVHSCLLSTTDPRARALSAPFSSEGRWRNFCYGWTCQVPDFAPLASMASCLSPWVQSSKTTSAPSILRRLITLVFAGWVPQFLIRPGLPLTYLRASSSYEPFPKKSRGFP